MSKQTRTSMWMGLIFASIALIHAFLMHSSIKGGSFAASVCSVMGALVIGAALWSRFVIQTDKFSFFRGGTVGFLTGWMSLYFGFVGWFGSRLLQEEGVSTEILHLVAETLIYSFVMPVFVVPLFGWAALGLCTLAGMCAVYFQKRADHGEWSPSKVL